MMRNPVYLMGLILFVAASSRAQEPPSGLELVSALENALVKVISRNEHSVVAVARVRRERPGEIFPFEYRPDPFGRRPAPPLAPQPTDPDFIPNEYGSGVVVGRGLVLISGQLLGDDSDYYVTTTDRKVVKAVVRGADPRSELAVLAADALDLPPVTLGRAEDLKKGQIVVSLGNPHAIARDGQPSATWGIVANLQRKLPPTLSDFDPAGRPALYAYGTLIQTDARLCLGTGGGPLLNLHGEMIGLVLTPAGAAGQESAGGYAIPVDDVFRRALDALSRGREVEYGFLGVQPANLRPEEVLGGKRGTRVGQIIPGSPAARADLKPNDVITAVNGVPIFDSDGLILEVGRMPADAVARLDVMRDGEARSVRVELSKFAVRGRKIVTAPDPAWRGLRVEYSTAVVDEEGNMRAGAAGADAVTVVEVAADSPAAAAGLRPGMLISHVDRTPVRTPKEFALAAARNRGTVQLRLAGDEKNPLRSVAPEM